MSVDAERHRLEAEAERLAEQQGDEVEQRLEDIYERWAGGWEAEHESSTALCPLPCWCCPLLLPCLHTLRS